MSDDQETEDQAFDMAKLLEQFKTPKRESSRGQRKAKQKQLAASVDGRSLRESGRTKQVNFRTTPAIAEALNKHIPEGKKMLWMEDAIIAKLRAEGVEVDA